MATKRKPAFSRRARISPACPAFTASGLTIENVRSFTVALPLLDLHRLRHGRPDVGRRAHDGDARRLHGLHLLLGRALAPGDDGPRVSHAPPRGRGLAGDESDHRLPDVLPDVGR